MCRSSTSSRTESEIRPEQSSTSICRVWPGPIIFELLASPLEKALSPSLERPLQDILSQGQFIERFYQALNNLLLERLDWTSAWEKALLVKKNKAQIIQSFALNWWLLKLSLSFRAWSYFSLISNHPWSSPRHDSVFYRSNEIPKLFGPGKKWFFKKPPCHKNCFFLNPFEMSFIKVSGDGIRRIRWICVFGKFIDRKRPRKVLVEN